MHHNYISKKNKIKLAQIANTGDSKIPIMLGKIVTCWCPKGVLDSSISRSSDHALFGTPEHQWNTNQKINVRKLALFVPL